MHFNVKKLWHLVLSFLVVVNIGYTNEPTKEGLATPAMSYGDPARGMRVRQVAPEYKGTEVYHTLYLPKDWEAGKKYPVLVEYTGNRFADAGSSGEVKDANFGYGLSGGKDFIWVCMPYIKKGGQKNEVMWWGDRDATIQYCKDNLPRICEEFGGDISNIFICGFSRGAIACSYIGLSDDQIASFWKGMITHDHFDGHKEWGYPQDNRSYALKRIARLKGKPVLVCGNHAEYLKNYQSLAHFTFLLVPVREIFQIPEGKVIHPHTDMWAHRQSTARQIARDWLLQNAGLN
jgi:hypothetical protein